MGFACNDMDFDYDYHIDVVFCIDRSSNSIVTNVLDVVDKICNMLIDTVQINGNDVEKLRVKILEFDDLSKNPFIESDFYNWENDKEKIEHYCSTIKTVQMESDYTTDAFEAISTAIRSQWTREGTRRRHIIIVLSDSYCCEYGKHATSPFYPQDIPTNLAELLALWEGTDSTYQGDFSNKSGRMITFALDAEPWSGLCVLMRHMLFFHNNIPGEFNGDFSQFFSDLELCL